MTTTFNWTIEKMDCYPQYAGQTDVVFTVYWRLTGIDGTYSAWDAGSLALTYTAGTPYTPYNQLTQDQVVGWVKDGLGPAVVASLEANVSQAIANQINPPVVQPPLPWAPPATLTGS